MDNCILQQLKTQKDKTLHTEMTEPPNIFHTELHLTLQI